MLAGVSTDYYARLERGNLTGVSDAVLEAIARALHLDEAEHAHLHDLARAANATPRARKRAAPGQRIRPVVQRILDGMTTMPAFVLNRRLDLLAANRLAVALYSPAYDDPSRPVNLARFCFLNPHATTLYKHWDEAANSTVAMLRIEAGPRPLRSRAVRSRRGVVHPQRLLPQSLGHPQCGPAPSRYQTVPSPRRRRPQPHLRGHGTLDRYRPDPPRLQPRTRQHLSGRTGSPRQLGRDAGSERPIHVALIRRTDRAEVTG